MEKFKFFSRCILVLPVWFGGIFIGGFIINLAFSLLTYLNEISLGSIIAMILKYGVSPFISALLGIYLGILITPSNKKIVSIILFTATVVLAVLNIIFNLYYEVDISIFWFILFSISLTIGAGYYLYQIFEDSENFNPFNNLFK